jgi:hypothetical protein
MAGGVRRTVLAAPTYPRPLRHSRQRSRDALSLPLALQVLLTALHPLGSGANLPTR